MKRRILSLAIAFLFAVSGAVPLAATIAAAASACCKTGHSCCRRHAPEQSTAPAFAAAKECPAGCRLGPGVFSGSSLFAPQAAAEFQNVAPVQEQLRRSESRIATVIASTSLYQRPPPRGF
jgi:hypothetical protein